MRIKGTLLKFDVVNISGDIFPKDCKIDIPDKLPLVYEYRYFDPNYILGYVEVERRGDGLYITGEIHPTGILSKDILEWMQTEFGLGGYYNGLLRQGDRIIESKLRAVNVVRHPVNKDYTFEIIEDGGEES